LHRTDKYSNDWKSPVQFHPTARACPARSIIVFISPNQSFVVFVAFVVSLIVVLLNTHISSFVSLNSISSPQFS
jgi:hypothetical protein